MAKPNIGDQKGAHQPPTPQRQVPFPPSKIPESRLAWLLDIVANCFSFVSAHTPRLCTCTLLTSHWGNHPPPPSMSKFFLFDLGFSPWCFPPFARLLLCIPTVPQLKFLLCYFSSTQICQTIASTQTLRRSAKLDVRPSCSQEKSPLLKDDTWATFLPCLVLGIFPSIRPPHPGATHGHDISMVMISLSPRIFFDDPLHTLIYIFTSRSCIGHKQAALDPRALHLPLMQDSHLGISFTHHIAARLHARQRIQAAAAGRSTFSPSARPPARMSAGTWVLVPLRREPVRTYLPPQICSMPASDLTPLG